MQPFTRMLWKEYRSLRMLWIGCVLGTFGLWGAISLTALARRNQYAVDDHLYLIWTLALWLPSIYIIGCNVAIFAGEKEERTAEWLTHMAVPLRPLLAAKLLWPIGSALAMQLVLFGGALLVQAAISGRMSISGSTSIDAMLSEWPKIASFSLLEALALSWFWSLHSSRPLMAAAAAAISLIALNAAAGIFLFPALRMANGGYTNFGELVFGPWGVLRTLLLIGLLAVDAALTRSWLAGRMKEWSIPWERFRVRRKVRVDSVSLEAPTAWRREWQRFRWLEWQSLLPFLILTGIASLAVSLPLLFWRKSGDENYQLPFLFFWAYILPLIAGLAAWQGEQSRQQFRFFVNRGVSPLGLWLNKFGLWLAALILSLGMLALLAALCLYCGHIWFLKSSIPVSEHFRIQANLMTRNMAPLDVSVWSGITLFASAFAATLYFRRAILAIGAALLMQIVLTIWLSAATVGLQLPVWIGIAPVAAWLVWCSLRQLPRWSLERTGWRPKAVIAAEWLAFPVLFAPVVIAYWVYSVPMPDIERQMRMRLSEFHNPAEAYAANWTPVREQMVQITSKARNFLLTHLRQEKDWPKIVEQKLRHRNDWLIPEDWQVIEQDVRVFRDTILSKMAITAETRFYQSLQQNGVEERHHMLAIGLLFQLADWELTAGNAQESIQAVRAAVRYTGALYADAPLFASEAAQRQLHRELQDRLLAWAEHPANSPATIHAALYEIDRSEIRWWMTDQLALRNGYEEWMAELQESLKAEGWRGIIYWPAFCHIRRLHATATSNLTRFRYQTLITQRSFAAFPPAMPIRDNAILPFSESDAAWAYRSPYGSWWIMSGNVPPNVPFGLTAESVTMLWDRETRIRCTCAALAAIAYRREHGKLPRTLNDVVSNFVSISLLTDPWTGNLLRIEPDGLNAPLKDGQSQVRLLDAATPFVWSVGPDLAVLNPGGGGEIYFNGSQGFSGGRGPRARYFTVIPTGNRLADDHPVDDQPADALDVGVPTF